MRISFYFSLYYILFIKFQRFPLLYKNFFKFIYSYFWLLISSSYVSILFLKTFGRVYVSSSSCSRRGFNYPPSVFQLSTFFLSVCLVFCLSPSLFPILHLFPHCTFCIIIPLLLSVRRPLTPTTTPSSSPAKRLLTTRSSCRTPRPTACRRTSTTPRSSWTLSRSLRRTRHPTTSRPLRAKWSQTRTAKTRRPVLPITNRTLSRTGLYILRLY